MFFPRGIMKNLFLAVGTLCVTSALVGCAGSNENAKLSADKSNDTTKAMALPEAESEALSLRAGETINLNGVGLCRVAQANGVVLSSSNLSRNDCINKCASYEATNPGRSCSHRSGFLRVAPRQVCQVVGAAGVVHFYALSGRMRCAQECNKYANPNRQCLWGGVSVKP